MANEVVKRKNKQEEIINPADKVKTPENKAPQLPKMELPKIEPVKIEPVVEKITPSEPYKAEENIIVIPQEYKIKSPAKYSFK